MTGERLKLFEKAEKKIDAYIDTLSQDKGGLADKLKQEDVKDFLVSLWIDCSTEVTKELQKHHKKVCQELTDTHRNLGEKIVDLEKQIEKMKSDSRTAYIKGIRTMANALKKYDREEGSWTDYFEHTVDKVLKNLLEEFGE